MTRRYQKTQALLPQSQQMLAPGMPKREVAEAVWLEGNRPVHELLKRERKSAAKGDSKTRGRKPANDLVEMQV